jgi:predicted O-linked N-acetylglucosamine transferase (SPINDLY family)
MLLAPAWHLPEAPELDTVPSWLWGEFAAWLFATPSEATAQTAAQFSGHWLKRLESLERWVQRNPGSAAVRAALPACLQARLNPALFSSPRELRRAAELRGSILCRSLGKERLPFDPLPQAREGRRLRVGFVARHFGPGADLYANLACFEHLDAKGFEVFLFALEHSDTPEAQYAARRAKRCEVLPSGPAYRLAQLRQAKLDVLVFVGDLAGPVDDLTGMAIRRIAPLQVVNHRTGGTTGLPEIDLFVSGTQPPTLAAAEAFTERLGLVRGPAHAFAFARANGLVPAPAPRERLGVPAEATLLATVVTDSGVSRATLAAWVGVLERCPTSHLLVAFVPEAASASIAPFCRRIDATLQKHGVESNRVTILPCSSAAPLTVCALLRAADLYLDATGHAPPHWLAEALAAGRPAVALAGAGNPDREAVAGLLRAAGVPELIAPTQEEYLRLAADLAGNAARRTACGSTVQSALEGGTAFLDTLAASDAFGAVLETAFDELVSLGREQFRAQREPLQCFGAEDVTEPVEAGLAAHARGDLDTAAFESAIALRSDPTHYRVRHLRGLVLQAQGESARAIDYLLAAVQDARATAAVWFDLAQALRASRRTAEAIEALRVCVRLEPQQVEPLLLLHELAESAGAIELTREVAQCLRAAAPEDPRVLAMG